MPAALADVYSLFLLLHNTLGAIRVVSQGIPEGIRFQQIVCGDDHAMALAAKGQVYAWGSGAQGRTGSVAGPDAVDTPTEIKRLWNAGCTRLAAGALHSVAVSYPWTAAPPAFNAAGLEDPHPNPNPNPDPDPNANADWRTKRTPLGTSPSPRHSLDQGRSSCRAGRGPWGCWRHWKRRSSGWSQARCLPSGKVRASLGPSRSGGRRR